MSTHGPVFGFSAGGFSSQVLSLSVREPFSRFLTDATLSLARGRAQPVRRDDRTSLTIGNMGMECELGEITR
jgi:hypothetical protein